MNKLIIFLMVALLGGATSCDQEVLEPVIQELQSEMMSTRCLAAENGCTTCTTYSIATGRIARHWIDCGGGGEDEDDPATTG